MVLGLARIWTTLITQKLVLRAIRQLRFWCVILRLSHLTWIQWGGEATGMSSTSRSPDDPWGENLNWEEKKATRRARFWLRVIGLCHELGLTVVIEASVLHLFFLLPEVQSHLESGVLRMLRHN